MNPPRSTRSLLVALSVIGAGLIHLAAIRTHLGSPMAVASFTGIGLVQILIGASLLQPGALRLKRFAVVGVGVLAVGAWLVSRTWGLPVVSGHSGPEPLGLADVAAATLQLASLLLVLLPDRATATGPHRVRGALMALPVVAVSALASLSLLSVPSHGDAHSEPVNPRSASHTPSGPLTKRAVPIPPTREQAEAEAEAQAEAKAEPEHDDPAGAPAHGH